MKCYLPHANKLVSRQAVGKYLRNIMCMNRDPYDGQQKGRPLNLPCIILSLLNSTVTDRSHFSEQNIVCKIIWHLNEHEKCVCLTNLRLFNLCLHYKKERNRETFAVMRYYNYYRTEIMYQMNGMEYVRSGTSDNWILEEAMSQCRILSELSTSPQQAAKWNFSMPSIIFPSAWSLAFCRIQCTSF